MPTTSTHHLTGLDRTSLILVIIGGLNWGLIGLFGFDLVAAIFGEMSALTRIIYTLVGVSALYLAAVSMNFSRGGYTNDTPYTHHTEHRTDTRP